MKNVRPDRAKTPIFLEAVIFSSGQAFNCVFRMVNKETGCLEIETSKKNPRTNMK